MGLDGLGSINLEAFDLTAVFAETGRTEKVSKRVYSQISDSVYLIATSFHNSLPASLEILTWIKNECGTGRIVQGSLEEVSNKLSDPCRTKNTRTNISASKMGLVVMRQTGSLRAM